MKKFNCWELKKCGREPGGDRAEVIGVCPSAVDESSNKINSGKNGGRICWSIAGTFCAGKVQGDFAQQTVSCMTCEVFSLIKQEESVETFILLKRGQSYNVSRQ